MHPFVVNWWNSNGQQSPQRSNFESPKQLGLQLSDDSSSSQSLGPPLREIGGMNGQSSQDHCFSAEPCQNESHGKDEEPQTEPDFLSGNPNLVNNPPTVDNVPSMDQFPYPCADPCFGGLFPGYGPQALVPVNSQMVAISPGRVPLPADVAENGPIYVNAKQYHGILRRRQLRAKLEAQNKLIKNRKPYLHESRHLHALKRVRGSGGRFVSAKKVQPNSAPATSSQCPFNHLHLDHSSMLSSGTHHSELAEFVTPNGTGLDIGNTQCPFNHLHLDNCSMLSSGTHHSELAEFVTPNANGLDIGNMPKSDSILQQLDGRFSSISSSHSGGVLQSNGGQMCSSTHHNASFFSEESRCVTDSNSSLAQ